MVAQEKLKDLERIIDKYQDSMFRFAFFRTGSLTDSQDIVQDIFLKMYESRIDLSGIDKIKSYLFRSIANSCSNYSRGKQTIETVPLDSVKLMIEDSNEDDIIKEYERISKIMEFIPKEQAEIIRMKTIDQLTFTEISEIMDIPLTTVKSRFKYGIDKLKFKITNRKA